MRYLTLKTFSLFPLEGQNQNIFYLLNKENKIEPGGRSIGLGASAAYGSRLWRRVGRQIAVTIV